MQSTLCARHAKDIHGPQDPVLTVSGSCAVCGAFPWHDFDTLNPPKSNANASENIQNILTDCVPVVLV